VINGKEKFTRILDLESYLAKIFGAH
jgi:hypothetical protein